MNLSGNYLRSGAISGAVSAFLFTALHQVIISNIWASLPVMVIAGATCGLCIAWTYGMLPARSTPRSWFAYNAAYIAMFALMGGISVVIYEPITTMGALVEAQEAPNELIAQAWPFTVAYTLGAAVLITLVFARSRLAFESILATCIVLVVTLGLNISIIGLVEIPRSSTYVVAELFALTVFLDLAYVVGFMALERISFRVAPAS